MKTPHILLASSNAHRLRTNLVGLLDANAIAKLDREISSNAVGLYKLGKEHFDFARSVPRSQWRQKVSRLYYGAYNIVRSLRFLHAGVYSTDSSDHKRIEDIPDDFPTKATYENKLTMLRDDRNLCDYDHTAEESDLLIAISDADQLVEQLLLDSANYLRNRGVTL